MTLRSVLCLAAVAASTLFVTPVRAGEPQGQTPVPTPTSEPLLTPGGVPETREQRDIRMAWWRDAKFGLFIHWGVYAVPAGSYDGKPVAGIGEWIMRRATPPIPVDIYQGYAKQFNPVKFDPSAWAQMAQDAGMRYVVITSKHHDGFALFPTSASRWNIVDSSPYGQEVIGPLAQAVRAHGLRFGLYYSQAQDWNNPGGAKSGYKDFEGWDSKQKGSFDGYLDKVAVPQVAEIIDRYLPDVIWFDTPILMNPERAAKFQPILQREPWLIANNRLGGGVKGDTDTPEQKIPATGIPGRDWETCMTINGTWGYKADDTNFKSVATLLHNLVDIVSKGGNYLLNVGPTAEGIVPEPEVDRLHEIGAWMKVNGEAIYGTTASQFPALPWGRSTSKLQGDRGKNGATLYLHVFDWPADGRLVVPGLKSHAWYASLLAGGTVLPVENTTEGVVVHVPPTAPDPNISVIRLEVTGPLLVSSP